VITFNKEASTIEKNKAVVILECQTIPPLNSGAASELASKEAVKMGLASPGISNTAGPYPVNAKGEATQEVATGQEPTVCYRREFTFMSAR
jgi:hypothetical protein